jgi:hypothetical protein
LKKGYISPAVLNAVLNAVFNAVPDDCRKHVTHPIDLLASREREALQTLVKRSPASSPEPVGANRLARAPRRHRSAPLPAAVF